MTLNKDDCVLADTEVFFLNSSAVGDEFKIFVAHPVTPVPAGARPGVIFALDANSNFGLVTDIVRGGTLTGGPCAFVVGIGYRTGFMTPDWFIKRSRDFTPDASPVFDEMGGLMVGKPDRRIATGGALAFLRFIREELKPLIEQKFAVDASETTLVGMSLGGLFAITTLFTQPDTFKRYLVCSPSLWWNQDNFRHYEEDWARAHQDLPARVFIAAGGEERHDKVEPKFRAASPELQPLLASFLNPDGHHLLAEHVEALVPQLKARNFPSLRITGKIFEDETHESVYPRALVMGLRTLFSPQFD